MVRQDEVLAVLKAEGRPMTVLEIMDVMGPQNRTTKSAYRASVYNGCSRLSVYGIVVKIVQGNEVRWTVPE